jgi:5S rRNA maturation endonuclease (ribonuclease M5)
VIGVRLAGWQIRDVRSIWGPAEDIELGERVTVLVGANRAGTSNVAFALAAALDAAIDFRPGRDLPRDRSADPSVLLWVDKGGDVEVSWDPDGGPRHVSGGQGAEQLTSGRVVYAQIHHTPRDLLRRLPPELLEQISRDDLAAAIRDTAQLIVPEVVAAEVDGQSKVLLFDVAGSALPVPLCRPLVALGLTRYLATIGEAPAATIIESPEAFLHPAAQEDLAALLVEVADDAACPVVITTTSPFVIPRVEQATVVAVARDASGRTGVVGTARGDAPQARQMGGLLRDGGLASVLDRLGRIAPGTRGVLIVEGGTDVAYLQTVAERLGRSEVLRDVVVQSSGGAMGAALAAIVLRAELDTPLVVLLDHDNPGRRARDTLTSRFGFSRQQQIVTYADVFDGSPPGIEAETLFDVDLLRRFVREQGPASHRGERDLHGVPHVELTSSGKSAFVGWIQDHARVEHLARWDALLDQLAERFGTAAGD